MFNFKYEESIKDRANDLFRVDKITMSSLGCEEVGYLKIAYIPDELPFFRFLDLIGTRFYADKGLETQIWHGDDLDHVTDAESRYNITYGMAQASRRFGWESSNQLAEEARSVTDFKQFLTDEGIMAALYEAFGGQHKMYCDYFVDRPYVDFIRIFEPFQGKKASIFLYTEGSRWLKERNMRLRLSTIVCDAAARVREVMKRENLLDPTEWVWYNNTETGYLVK